MKVFIYQKYVTPHFTSYAETLTCIKLKFFLKLDKNTHEKDLHISDTVIIIIKLSQN